MLANSGKDENGKYKNGIAGDQIGAEWNIIPWYNRPWNLMLRYEGERAEEVQYLISELASEAALNNNIGYDQYQRTTFWYALEKANYKPSLITEPCEADCSSGTIAICKAAGYILGLDPLKNINFNGYSGNIREILIKAGFKAYTSTKYLNSDDFLLPGDILVYIGHHVAINLSQGEKVEVKNPYSLGWNKDSVGWWYADSPYTYLKEKWEVINNHWYYFNSQGYILTGLNLVNEKLYYFTETGDLEGALQHTTEAGELVEWFIP